MAQGVTENPTGLEVSEDAIALLTIKSFRGAFFQLIKLHISGLPHVQVRLKVAGPRSAIGRAPDSQVRGPGLDTRSGNILSFLLPLFQEGQLSVTGESMCTKYWLTA